MQQKTSRKKLIDVAFAFLVVMGAIVASLAVAETKDKPAAGDAATGAQPQLPPGWTEADMMALVKAATPGEQHKDMARQVGTWNGKNTMWMSPDAPPMTAESKTVITPIMDGRYVKAEVTGDMPGMGPFKGMGIYGYDNVQQKFVATWIDSHSTGIMNGVGEMSPDGKTLTYTYSYHCPITKKPTKVREVHTTTGETTKTLEMYGTEPKSGKEFKMMKIELTKAA
jgi:hypothetical protein